MKTLRWNGLFEIKVPDHWTSSEDGAVVSFFDAKFGVGTIQISFARRKQPGNPSADDAMQLARYYVAQKDWSVNDASIRAYELAEMPASEFSFVDSTTDTYWCVWHIINPRRVAFVTYNCTAEDQKTEEKERNAIVQSFRWLDNSTGESVKISV